MDEYKVINETTNKVFGISAIQLTVPSGECDE